MGQPISHIVGFDGQTYDIPTGGGAVRIYYSAGEWLDYNTEENIYNMDIGTIVLFTGYNSTIDLSQDSSKLILEYPYTEKFSNYAELNYKYLTKKEAFVGVIVGKKSAYETTIVKRIDADCTHFPNNINSSMANVNSDNFDLLCGKVRDSIGSALIFEDPGTYEIPNVYQSDGSTKYSIGNYKHIAWANGYSAYVLEISDNLRGVPIKVKGNIFGRLMAATYSGITTTYVLRESHDTYSLTVPDGNAPALVLWYGPY